MLGSVALSYGLFAGYALRFILPSRGSRRRTKVFITSTSEVPVGGSFYFTTPDGEEFVVTHGASPLKPFVAYSSRCPHLGCRVHWQDEEKRFYCPCHGGAFDSGGMAVAGPPAKAQQRLKSCELVVDGSMIYAMVRTA